MEREAGRWAAQHDRLRYQPEVLRHLIKTYQYQLKFVITSAPDLSEVENILSDLNADRHRVLLMPEGTDPETIRNHSLELVEICKQTGFRFSPRLHIDLWGNRRGV